MEPSQRVEAGHRVEEAADRVPKVWRDLFRPPWRESALVVIGCAPATTLVCWFFGADIWHAAAIAACLCAVGIAWITWPVERPVPWRQHHESHEGGRWDVARLSWSLHGRRGRVGPEALRRVQAIGRRRLASYHLDPLAPADVPAIENLIGGAALAVLRSSGAGSAAAHTPTMRAFVDCLDALDALEPTDIGGGRRVAAPSRLRAMLRRLGRWPVVTSLRRSTRRDR